MLKSFFHQKSSVIPKFEQIFFLLIFGFDRKLSLFWVDCIASQSNKKLLTWNIINFIIKIQFKTLFFCCNVFDANSFDVELRHERPIKKYVFDVIFSTFKYLMPLSKSRKSLKRFEIISHFFYFSWEIKLCLLRKWTL